MASVSEMKMSRTSSKLGLIPWFVVAFFVVITVFGVAAGCGTFSGMSSDEVDQANRDLANESGFNPAFRPERSLTDRREIPVNVPGPSAP